MINYNLLLEEFNNLKSDVEKWQWIAKNQNIGITVQLDNDDTFATFDNADEDTDVLQFKYYIGNAEGIEDLLNAFGIKSEEV